MVVLQSLDQLASDDHKDIIVGQFVVFPDWIESNEVFGEDVCAVVEVFLLKDFD